MYYSNYMFQDICGFCKRICARTWEASKGKNERLRIQRSGRHSDSDASTTKSTTESKTMSMRADDQDEVKTKTWRMNCWLSES